VHLTDEFRRGEHASQGGAEEAGRNPDAAAQVEKS